MNHQKLVWMFVLFEKLYAWMHVLWYMCNSANCVCF